MASERSAPIEFRLFGAVEAARNGSTLALGGPRQRALLALLLLEPGTAVSADQLVEELWREAPPRAAASTLRSYVSRLRSAIGGDAAITGGAAGYAVHVAPERIDVVRFERLIGEGRLALAHGAAARAAERLAAALALWRGPPFGDLADEGALRAEAMRLEELRVLALEERLDADLALGRSSALVDELETLVAEAPLPRAAVASADVGALPGGTSGGRARRVSPRPVAPRRGAGSRAERGAEEARAGDPAPRGRARAAAGAAQPTCAGDELRRPRGRARRRRGAAGRDATADADGRRRGRQDAPGTRGGVAGAAGLSPTASSSSTSPVSPSPRSCSRHVAGALDLREESAMDVTDQVVRASPRGRAPARPRQLRAPARDVRGARPRTCSGSARSCASSRRAASCSARPGSSTTRCRRSPCPRPTRIRRSGAPPRLSDSS